MSARFKGAVIAVAVVSVLIITGGIFCTASVAATSREYVWTNGVIDDIETESGENDTVTVKKITVSFTDTDGVSHKAELINFPPKLEKGAIISVRYKVGFFDEVTSEKFDWFTPVFLLVLGVLYLSCGTIFLLLRKKAGFYASSETLFPDNKESDDGETDVPQEIS